MKPDQYGVYQPNSKHKHIGPVAARGRETKSLARCRCGKWLFVQGVYARQWKPVRWYHLGLLFKIAQIEQEERSR